MKKLIFIGAIALTITLSLTPQASDYETICRVSSVQLQNGIYQTTVVDENGEAWAVEADRDLTGKWLNVHANDRGTKDTLDDEFYGFDILGD